MQNNLYPKTPLNVPADLTSPNKTYRKHVWIASLALILFIILYIGLSIWFIYKSYKLFGNTFSGGREGVLTFISGVIMAFLGVFMLKALFFISKRNETNDIEIKKEDEPLLFEFIYKVADEAKAPRPHKVFLSNTVNACVFYHISIINLFFPTRKNLEIGLGLVNTLNLAEFKSILAHEFGHFAQKSMIIGRWVYIAYQVAHQIVAKRDGFDKFLNGLSSTDFRIAWVGWVLSIIIWSIRAISETFFKLVLITQRALSREMEFHADLVAVSLTGSDTLIHSLYKLNAADEAYEEALEFVNKQLKKKKAVSDIYAIQTNSIKHMAVVLNDPTYGLSPNLNGRDGSTFKVFKEQIAQTPKMWNTHPSNIDREKNAKAIYIKSEVDERSSWVLFKDPDAIKNKVTLNLYTDLKIETTPLTKQDSLELHDKEFKRSFLLPKYKGAYLNRPTLLGFKTVEAIYTMDIDRAALASQFTLLYPESIQHHLSYLKDLDEEIAMLEGLNKKTLDANEGKINYRKNEISRNELPDIIASVKKEAESIRAIISEHDKLCRNVYYTAAKNSGNGWPEYLVSVTKLVHYCEHSQKNIEELSRFFYDTLAVVSKIRKVSNADMLPLLRSANELHSALESVFVNANKLKLNAQISEKLGGIQFEELLQPFGLGIADHNNINSWIDVVGGWINLALSALNSLKEAALDELLLTEDAIEKATVSGTSYPAPDPIMMFEYFAFDPSIKREVTQKPDMLSRFYSADGVLPTFYRLAVSAVIILFAIFFSSYIGQSSLLIYNGMPVDVVVQIDKETFPIPAYNHTDVLIDKSGKISIKASTANGEEIETISPELSDNSRTFVYNIASAAVLYEWTVYYGTRDFGFSNNNSKLLGAKRWMETSADYYFEEPPSTISMPKGQTSMSKVVLAVYLDHPAQVAASITDEKEKNDFLTIHSLWERSNSKYFLSWLAMAGELKTFPDILKKRLAKDPFEVASLRMQQEFYKDKEKIKICEEQTKFYLKNPDNPNLYYLYIRCMEDSPKQDSLFVEGYKKWPKNQWLAYSSSFVFTQKEAWNSVLECYEFVNEASPELREGVLEEMKRVCHLLKKDDVIEKINTDDVPYLRFVKAIENSRKANAFENNAITGDEVDQLYSYKLLAQGNIQEALDYCKTDSSLYNSILRLAAVSDGATQDICLKAIAIKPTRDINSGTLIPALALNVKYNLAIDDYRDAFKNMGQLSADTVFKFINYLKINKIDEADKLLIAMTAEMKGKIGLLGILIVGKNAPEKWNLYASTLLFLNEKPYRKDELKDWKTEELK